MDEYRFGLQSTRSWCDQTFESEEVKCLFGAFALFMAHAPDDAGGAERAWLFGTVLQDAGNNLVKGGMHHVSLTLADHLRSLGARSGPAQGWRRSSLARAGPRESSWRVARRYPSGGSWPQG